MPTTTGKRPGSGVLPSFEGRATVAPSCTPSSIRIRTSVETLLKVGAGSFGGGAAAADAGAAARHASATAQLLFHAPPTAERTPQIASARARRHDRLPWPSRS